MKRARQECARYVQGAAGSLGWRVVWRMRAEGDVVRLWKTRSHKPLKGMEEIFDSYFEYREAGMGDVGRGVI